MIHIAILCVCAITVTDGFIYQAQGPLSRTRGIVRPNAASSREANRCGLSMSVLSPLMDELTTFFDLKETDYSDAMGASFSRGDLTAKCVWLDEKMGSKLTGVSSSTINKGDDAVSFVNAWMGPTSFVPHMMLSVGKNCEGHFLEADYMPRGQFAFGSDASYVENYYDTPEILTWYADAVSKGKHMVPPDSFSGRLLRSPVYIKMGGLSEGDAMALAQQHLSRWLEWIENATPSEARQRGGLNVRDDKLRQFAFRANLVYAKSITSSDDDAKALAAGLTGPLAEAYVGGGS